MNTNAESDLYEFTEPFKAPRGSAIRELFKYLGRPGMISFAGGYPSKDLFDRVGIGHAIEEAYRADPVACLQYGDTAGSPALRRAIVRLMNERGVSREIDDLIVTTGSQQGLDLLIKILVAPGDAVLIEEPAYPAAIQALRLAGAKLIPVRTDAQGIDVDALTEQLEALELLDPGARPKLLYTVPTFANPTGTTLPVARREALARLAVRFRFVLIEDDPYGELRFTGDPVKPVIALADAIPGARDWVVYFGSLSKIVAPGLRIGWSIAPPAITRRMLVAKQTSDLCTSPLAQETARCYLESGRLAEHVPVIVQTYKKRYEALASALRQFVPNDIDYVVPQGGMFVWARLNGGRQSAEVLKRAIEQNVIYVPGPAFYVHNADESSMRLSFAAAPGEAEVFEGVRRLKLALASR
ncbi:2-aminoadipate aminotransferase [Burkholderia sp. Leaf177]|uniref:aminotransferase-like domain-containing protein n=1 Tax=Burkholderia sp. Leaf177 TaxID=1736287 RepID=UPI0006F7A0D8|nr:PLP-dependent aminotransferase family protein [Burkholderia sp. Leaf177]KQR84341.1 2-aminoadipate aminotransferase [Burkholderia sp. Leaf177]